MRYIDTHTHLFDEAFRNDLPAVVERAEKAGMVQALLPCINLATWKDMMDVCRAYPRLCRPMLGIHPTEIGPFYLQELREMHAMLVKGSALYTAIGEVGLDFYRDRSQYKAQLDVFETQVQWAIEFDLPLMIHCRKAQPELVAVLKKYKTDRLRGVFHCFSGSYEMACQLLELGDFMLGIGGVVTYHNTKLPKTLARLPLGKIVLETDAPYMTPVPHRGERNEPSYIPYVIDTLSGIYGLAPDEIGEATIKNTVRMFHLKTTNKHSLCSV